MREDKRQVESKANSSSSGSEKLNRSIKSRKAVSRPNEVAHSTKTALVVVGMHRSGTSAISRVLNLLGADLPKKLLPPRPSNPAGFWESKDVMTLHDRMLSAVGASWDDPGYLSAFWKNDELRHAYQKSFSEIIDNEFDGSSFFVLKDPRISRFIPLTIAALNEIEITPKFIVAVRNPLEVAASLKVRDEFHLSKGLLLWLDHSLRAERMTRNFPRTFVLYDEMLIDWRSSFRTVGEDLQLTFPGWNTKNDTLIESFLTPKLRNHQFSLEDMMLREDIAQWVKASYETLRMLAHGQSDSSAQKKLNRLYAEFKKAQKAFGPVLAQERVSLQRIARERDDVKKTLKERESTVENLSQSLEEARKQSESLRLQYDSAVEKRDDAVVEASDQAQEVERLSAQLLSFQSDYDALCSKYEGVVKARDDAASEANEKKREVRKLSDKFSALQSRADRLLSDYEKIAKERDQYAKEAEEAKRLSRQLESIRSEFDALNEKNELVAKERDTVASRLAAQEGETERISQELLLARSESKSLRTETRVLRSDFNALTVERDKACKTADSLLAEKKQLLRQISRQVDVASVLREQLSAVQRQRDAMRDSCLWRMMSPVRAMGAFGSGLLEKARLARPFLKVARSKGLKKANEFLEYRRLLLSSGLFDIQYYKNKNPECFDAGDDPVSHYLMRGACEGRDPNPLFDSSWYLDKYPDIARSGMNPLRHFLLYGAREKRDPHPLFQTKWYMEQNPDVLSSGVNPLVHYLMFGGTEGRNPNPFFDGEWYLQQNPAVAEAGINPLVHFDEQGWREGRDPSTEFNVRFYLEINEDVAASGDNPLAHYLRVGRVEGRAALPPPPDQSQPYTRIKGSRPRVKGWKTILVVAHFVSERLFGAERSFLDMLDGLSDMNVNVIAVLPGNRARYTEAVRARSAEVIIFKYDWWKKEHPVSDDIIRTFETVITKYQVNAVHVNTIMLREPLLAAASCGVISVVQVRELIRDDKWLADAIGVPPEQIVKEILSSTDWVIANSETTREAFEKKSRTFVIPNPVDLKDLDIPNIVDPENVRFGLISSNIRKKGIEDLVELAKICADDIPNAQFVLIGPETRLIKQLRLEQANGDIPQNIEFAGYADTPKAGIEKVNVILNLSHFKESFGRTVAEGMAARRPTIAYNWGALPELVVDELTGFLIPYRKVAMAVSAIRKLCANVKTITEMGAAARCRVEQSSSKKMYSEHFRQAYLKIFNQVDRTEQSLNGRADRSAESIADRTAHQSKQPRQLGSDYKASPGLVRQKEVDVSVIIPNFNYATYLPERLRSILEQSISPREIIFIDDASQDDSVQVVRPILERAGIPFQIQVNKSNVGPYANWKKGLSIARGSFVWIAEADDSCESNFLESVMAPVMTSEDVVISYAQSRKIDGAGNTISEDSLAHTDEISPSRWRSSYIEPGVREVVDALAYRNTIPNVSACVVKRSTAVEASDVLDNYRYCGDWAFYANMLLNGCIAYNHQPLNSFRRHDRSQTRRTFKSADFITEVAKVRVSICRDFPIRLHQFSRMDHFLNKDYPVEGIASNVSHPPVAKIIKSAAEHAKNRKLIAFVTTNNGSYAGGSEVLWREAALALREAGHDVVGLIKKWDPAPDFFREFKSVGIKLYFKEEDGFDSITLLEPDMVIVSTGDQDEGTEYFSELIRREIKYVIVNQLTKEERFWPIRIEKLEAVRDGYSCAERVFFTCKNNHRVMESRLRCSLQNVDYHFNPFHIDRNKVPPFPDTSDVYRIAVPSKLLYIHKGQDLLIDVLKARKWQRRPVVINIYGVGDDREKMEKSVSDLHIKNLVFRGRVADIAEIWEENHAILMPSRMEGLPIMLVSAMLSGRVPIVTDIGGHAELVEDDVCGFIAADPDPESIDEAMERAWAVRQDWERFGERARNQVLEFLPDDPVADFLDKVHQIMEAQVEQETV